VTNHTCPENYHFFLELILVMNASLINSSYYELRKSHGYIHKD
jgi:hypothetical protein